MRLKRSVTSLPCEKLFTDLEQTSRELRCLCCRRCRAEHLQIAMDDDPTSVLLGERGQHYDVVALEQRSFRADLRLLLEEELQVIIVRGDVDPVNFARIASPRSSTRCASGCR